MTPTLYRILSLLGDARAVSKGPAAVVRRLVRKTSHRSLARLLRKAGV